MKGDVTRKGAEYLSIQELFFNSVKGGLVGFIVFIALSVATRYLDSVLGSNHHFVVMELWDLLLGALCFVLVFSFRFLEQYQKK